MDMGKASTVLVSDFVYNIFGLDAAKHCFGPSRTTLHTLCKHDQLFVFNCAANTILHQPVAKSQKLFRESLVLYICTIIPWPDWFQ